MTDMNTTPMVPDAKEGEVLDRYHFKIYPPHASWTGVERGHEATKLAVESLAGQTLRWKEENGIFYGFDSQRDLAGTVRPYAMLSLSAC